MMSFHSVTFGGKFLQSAVNVYTQRYLCSYPTILMTFFNELLDGAATTPEIRCHETAQLPGGNSGIYLEKAKNITGVWSPGLQSKDG